MKVCENCGKEYDDAAEASCPYCASSGESDIIKGDFPAFVPDVMNYAGDVEVKQESFRENRVAIYRRNQMIAAKQNIIEAKNEYIRVRLPERKKSTVIRGENVVYRVKPAAQTLPAPPAPASKKRSAVNRYAAIALGFAAFIATFLIVVLTMDSLKDPVPEITAQQREDLQSAGDVYSIDYKPEIDYNAPVEFSLEKNGLYLDVRKQPNTYGAFDYDCTFEFTNSSNATVSNFPELFSGAENADRIKEMIVFYPSGGRLRLTWNEGAATEKFPTIIRTGTGYDIIENYDIAPGEKAVGFIISG